MAELRRPLTILDNRIVELRKSYSPPLSQEKLGSLGGRTGRQIWKVETQKGGHVGELETYFRLAAVFGLTVEDLLVTAKSRRPTAMPTGLFRVISLKIVGNQIGALRTSAGLTFAQLDAGARLETGEAQRLEERPRRVATPEDALQIAHFLDVSVAALYLLDAKIKPVKRDQI